MRCRGLGGRLGADEERAVRAGLESALRYASAAEKGTLLAALKEMDDGKMRARAAAVS